MQWRQGLAKRQTNPEEHRIMVTNGGVMEQLLIVIWEVDMKRIIGEGEGRDTRAWMLE